MSFILGIIFGMLVAWYLVPNPPEMVDNLIHNIYVKIVELFKTKQ